MSYAGPTPPPPVFVYCSFPRFEVVTQPTAATPNSFIAIPTTRGGAPSMALNIHVDLDGSVDPSFAIGFFGGITDEESMTHRVGDELTIAPGLLGAGSSGMVLSIAEMICWDSEGNPFPQGQD